MRRTLALVLLSALLGCSRRTGPEAGAKAEAGGCPETPALGWLDRLAEDEDPRARLEADDGGWIALYKHDHEAATRELSASEDRVARLAGARALLEQGALELALGRLLARAQARYLEARAALAGSTRALERAGYHHGVSLVVSGDPEGARARFAAAAGEEDGATWTQALAERWPTSCGPLPADAGAWAVVFRQAACGVSATCTTPLPDPGDDQDAAAFLAAVCGELDLEDAKRLARRASRPIASEAGETGGEVQARVDYYDPLSLWALAQAHLRQAEVLATREGPPGRLLAAWAAATRGDTVGARAHLAAAEAGDDATWLVFSSFPDAAAARGHVDRILSGPGAGALDPDALIASIRGAQVEAQEAIECRASKAAARLFDELGLAETLVAARARPPVAARAHDGEVCPAALRVLRATGEGTLDAVSHQNAPSLLVAVAEAALCAGRSSEAIGALHALKAHTEPARPVLDVIERLAVARMMGGTGGTQRVQ